MEEKRKSPRVGKVVLRPSPTALKLMLIVLILFCTAALVALRWVHSGIQAETQSLLDEAAAIARDYAREQAIARADQRHGHRMKGGTSQDI